VEIPRRSTAQLILLLVLAMAASMPAPSFAQTAIARTGTLPTLEVYVIDVEGGNAVLFVSPSHESLLMDTGNVGAVAAPRDAGRIVDAMKAAGVQRIDHLITTHWHGDHFGGMAELASRVPIAEFIDHGPNVQPGEGADTFLRSTTRNSTPTPNTLWRRRATGFLWRISTCAC
jgi:beta-lactamase superfamily II metal-dependent hydrolase